MNNNIRVKHIVVSYCMTGNMGFKTLEERINDWSSSTSFSSIISIKYQVYVNTHTANDYGQNYSATHCALIIYSI